MQIFLFKTRSFLIFGLFILMLMGTFPYSHAQQMPAIEPLLQVIKRSKEDTSKVNALKKLALSYQKENPEKSFDYALKALTLAQKLEYHIGVTEGFDIIGYYYYGQGNYKKAIENFKESLKIAKKINSDRKMATAYNSLGRAYLKIGDFKKSLGHFNISLEKWKTIGNDKKIAGALNNIGAVYGSSGNYEKASKYIEQSIEIKTRLGHREGVTKSLSNIGNCYLVMGDYQKAMDSYFKSVKLCNEFNDPEGEASAFANIGELYKNLKDYSKALHYYDQSLKTFQKINDQSGIATGHRGVGSIYKETGDYKEALAFFEKALQVNQKIGDKKNLATTLTDIGSVYLHSKEYNKALNYFLQSLSISKEIDDKKQLANTYYEIGNVKKLKGNPNKAILAYEDGLSIAKEIKAKHIIQNGSLYLSNTYRQTGNHQKALSYYKQYAVMKDSIFNQEKTDKITQLEILYDIENYEKEMELQQAELEKKEEVLANRKRQLIALTIGTILSIALLVAIAINYRNKTKARQLVAQKNEEINQRKVNEILQKQKLETVKSELHGQEKERMRIAKELHDGIIGSLSAIQLNLGSLEKKGPILSKVITDLGNACKEARNISHKLSPLYIFQEPFPEIVRHYVEKTAHATTLDIQLEVYPEAYFNFLDKVVKSNIYRIIQELLNNINKHAEATEVTVQLIHLADENAINLLVTDNGKGFDPKENRQGIGLKNIASRLELIGGQILIDSFPGQGTTINITIQEKTGHQMASTA